MAVKDLKYVFMIMVDFIDQRYTLPIFSLKLTNFEPLTHAFNE